ncbi:hypothetical protein PRO82_001102 [Candidatus Protochlamydia amoebophila]|uniref:hypothetical protein n=1 Tax=Candidatus Protochlamydia amoebophila TaxID=362787 RepID=UPI001BC97374|nr:hypothetical protein [Candidatus Protochlamydia amoebophila]MBS4163796.1 hypothetical protein [Candidatus Protochlamydia amoebophila]
MQLNSSFFSLKQQDNNKFKIEDYQSTIPGQKRAIGFLQQLSQVLVENSLDENISNQMIDIAISTIQNRLEKKRIYNFLQGIPFTHANKLSKLICQVKENNLKRAKEINLKKDEKIKNKVEQASLNKTDINQFFIVNQKTIQKILNAKEHSHNQQLRLKLNEVLLTYALASSEVGMIGSNFVAFLESRGELLCPFVLKFDSENKMVKILDKDMRPEIYGKMTSFADMTLKLKRDIFEKLNVLC